MDIVMGQFQFNVDVLVCVCTLATIAWLGWCWSRERRSQP